MLSFKPAFSLVTFPGGFIPQVGKSVVGLTTLEQCGNFFGIIVLQFMRCLLGSSIVRLMTISFKRTYATCLASQDCCCQSPCPCCRPLLTCASSGDTQRLVWLSLLWRSMLLSLGPDAHKVLFVRSKHLWWLWGLI